MTEAAPVSIVSGGDETRPHQRRRCVFRFANDKSTQRLNPSLTPEGIRAPPPAKGRQPMSSSTMKPVTTIRTSDERFVRSALAHIAPYGDGAMLS